MDGQVPAMLVHPDEDFGRPRPTVLWMHGRTVTKEIDPGRFLRLLRAGIAACAVDLPGHGERYDAALQDPARSLDVVLGMRSEIDGIVASIADMPWFDTACLGIGGMSAGGMATMSRLCEPHPFQAVSIEASSGSWSHQQHRAMFAGRSDAEVRAVDPIHRLDGWREIPFLAFHTRTDAWVDFAGQEAFVGALRDRYVDPSMVEFVVFEETGAPFEHAGFGRMAAEVKNRQTAFFVEHLTANMP